MHLIKPSKHASAVATAFTTAALFASATISMAQVQTQPPLDSVVAVVADAMSLPFVPPDQRPVFGTFWEVRSSLPCVTAPLPFPPLDTNAPVYSIGDPIIGGQFLVDQTAGLVISPQALSNRRALSSMTTASILQAQVEELQTFVAGVQTRQAYAELHANEQTAPLSLDGGGALGPMGLDSYTTNDLWLEIVTVTNFTGFFLVHPPEAEATTGVYDLFMTTNLSPNVPGLNLTNWLWLLRTEPGETNLIVPDLWADQAYFMLGRTNSTAGDGVSDAFKNLVLHVPVDTPVGPVIVSEPIDQDVLEWDAVTFSVAASAGGAALAYQWACNGTNIPGATASSYTLNSVQSGDAAGYSVTVSTEYASTASRTAQLTVEPGTGNPLLMMLQGARQDCVFRSGVTYYIRSPVELFGTTTLRGGSVIKFDSWYYPDSSLVVKGALVCDTQPYFPAILTSVDDDAQGLWLHGLSSGSPWMAPGEVAYLNLDAAGGTSLSNLRICFAGQGVTTPLRSRELDVWDCQFYQCSTAIANQAPGSGGRDRLHNVLFAQCGAAIAASTNSVEIDAEHVTADVTNFLSASVPACKLALTNSIILGTLGQATITSTPNTALNPASTIFQAADYGGYYLAPNSPCRGAGASAISPRLASEFQRKSTSAPLALPAGMQLSGTMTLLPRVARYTGGAPDIGYWYDALDYTVAEFFLNGGTLTVEPGTAIAVRNQFVPGRCTSEGFDLWEGSALVSHGTPGNPNVFTAETLVQETPETDFAYYQRVTYAFWFVWVPGAITFVPDYLPTDQAKPAPTLDLRFCQLYLPSLDYHLWSGLIEFPDYSGYDAEISADSAVYFKLRNCNVLGGNITIGQPDYGSHDWAQVYAPGAVTWANNLFDQVSIFVDPAYWAYGFATNGLNVDLAFQAHNNLFQGGRWFELGAVPATAGNWSLTDNLFDKVNFVQDTNAPLDFSHNAYWPLTASELAAAYYNYGWNVTNASRLLPTISGGGANDQVLAAAPPYQTGPLGRHYLPATTSLYHAGSRPATDAGLFHYTTRLDQAKEGAGQMVNIGLHYVATIGPTNAQPKDSDGDGIPDYAENWHGDGNYSAHANNETDWQTAYTAGGIYDPTNTLYDNIDLSGNGLVGRIKKALGLNPLSRSTPLQLTQVITGGEPDFATFVVPISYDTVTNLGTLQLRVDGESAKLQDVARATNGSCLLIWNTTYEPPGQRHLQAELRFDGETDENTVMSGVGTMAAFNSANMVQFFEATSAFTDSGTTIYAQTPTCPDASYIVELRAPTGQHIRSFTNSTSTGVISELWDGTYDDGVTPYTGEALDAVFNVTLLDPGNGTNVQRLNKTYGVIEGNFDVAYAYNPSSELQKDGSWWNQMTAVVDKLLAPRNGYDAVYNSTFNWYWEGGNPGYPGYLPDRTKALSLLTNLAVVDTKNFYYFGHGSSSSLGDGTTNANRAYLSVWEVGRMLTNRWSTNGITAKHPYRFVFLDGCETAQSANWPHAFGVYDPSPPGLPATSIGRQAFLGWDAVVGGIRDTNDAVIPDLANAYGTTINLFYTFWMSKAQAWACISAASATNLAMPLPVKGNETYTVNNTRYTRSTANLKLIGYRDLTRAN